MALCPYGASVKPGSPDTFQYDEPFVLQLVGVAPIPGAALAGLALIQALQLPTDPQNTADFVAHEPTGELPTAQDWAAIAFPPTGFFTGAYERLGNWIRLNKWSELAICNVPPPGSPELSVHLCNMVVSPAANTELSGQCGPYNGYWTYSLVPTAANVPAGAENGITFLAASVHATPFLDTLANFRNVGGVKDELSYADPQPWLLAGNSVWPDQMYISGWWTDVGATPGQSVNVEVWGQLATPVPTAPVLPDIHGPVTPPVDDCAGCGDAVNALSGKIDYLTALVRYLATIVTPPGVVRGPDATPVPPATPGAPAPKVTKPPTAIGFVVEVTTVPIQVARYGSDPMFYADLGHYAMLTAEGPLPSALIKHNPLVVLNLAPQVTEVAFDMFPGAAAQVSWLFPPK